MQHSTGPNTSSVAMRMSSLTSPNNVGSMKNPSSPFRLPVWQHMLVILRCVDHDMEAEDSRLDARRQ